LRRVLGWSGLLVVAAVVVAAGTYVVFWPLSDLIARHDVGAVTGTHRAAALQTARDAARGRLLAFGAGLFAAGALIYTARNFTLSRRAVQITEQGQVTDRYTKAIEQLGSDTLDVRIGGIYALERVARDSPRDHPTIMEVLVAFVHEHSQEPWPPSASNEPSGAPPLRMTRPDVQAAVTVLGRRNPRYDQQSIDLSAVSLTRARLRRADLGGADLTATDLTGADLHHANLHDTTLVMTDLTSADLHGTDFTGARALDNANLSGAHLTGAIWPQDVPVPEGWVRDPDSGRLRRASEGTGDAGN